MADKKQSESDDANEPAPKITDLHDDQMPNEFQPLPAHVAVADSPEQAPYDRPGIDADHPSVKAIDPMDQIAKSHGGNAKESKAK